MRSISPGEDDGSISKVGSLYANKRKFMKGGPMSSDEVKMNMDILKEINEMKKQERMTREATRE